MKYIDITTSDVNNGPGCRVTLWIPGCMHNCKGCHNEWAQNYSVGEKFTEDTYKYLIEKLSKPYIAGLTISGGDPLYQDVDVLEHLYNIICDIRRDLPEKTIWLYTGFYYENLNTTQKQIADLCDVIVDGPFIEEQKDLTLPFRGSKNQRIIYIKDKLTE